METSRQPRTEHNVPMPATIGRRHWINCGDGVHKTTYHRDSPAPKDAHATAPHPTISWLRIAFFFADCGLGVWVGLCVYLWLVAHVGQLVIPEAVVLG